MKKPTKIDWARLAAFIDGEGCIHIIKEVKRKGSKENWNHHYALRIDVSNTDPRLPLWCKSLFGGFVASHDYANQKHKSRFNWVVSNDRAEWVLRNCLDLFVIKREQAEIGLSFRATFTGFPKKLGIPENILNTRENMFKRMKSMRKEAHEASTFIQ